MEYAFKTFLLCLDVFSKLHIEFGNNFGLEGAVKFRVKVGIGQMCHDMVDISFFRKPTVEDFMSHPNTKGIDAQERLCRSIKGNCDAQFLFWMSPMEMHFIIRFPLFGEYPAIGLVFDVQKLGRIEPMSRSVLSWIAT